MALLPPTRASLWPCLGSNKKVGSRPLDTATNLEATHYNFVISETQPRSQDAFGVRSKIVSLEEDKEECVRAIRRELFAKHLNR